MRVLHVARPIAGGALVVAGELVADQVRRGWAVTVACPAASDLRGSVLAAGATHLAWDATRAPGPSVPGETARLLRLARQADPDIVHLHSAKAGLAGRLAIRGGRTTLFQPHAWSFEAVRGPIRAATVAWERAAARWTDAFVCVSEDERRRGEGAGIVGHFEVVPNGVEVSRWSPVSDREKRAARRQLDLGDGPLAICVGRLVEEKGQDLLLRSWSRTLRTVPAGRLAIVGDGPERTALEQLAGPGVLFVGKRTDVETWTAAADVIAVPSRREAGLPLAAMEGMARGRSVVATDVAGVREGLGGVCGAVVPVAAVEALADALVERLLDPELAAREGREGRRRVIERYDLSRSTARMAALYESVSRPAREEGA